MNIGYLDPVENHAYMTRYLPTRYLQKYVYGGFPPKTTGTFLGGPHDKDDNIYTCRHTCVHTCNSYHAHPNKLYNPMIAATRQRTSETPLSSWDLFKGLVKIVVIVL